MKIREAMERLEGAKNFNFMGRPKVCEAIDIALIALEKMLHHCDYCEHCQHEDDGKLVCEFVEGNEGLKINVTPPDNMPCKNWGAADES